MVQLAPLHICSSLLVLLLLACNDGWQALDERELQPAPSACPTASPDALPSAELDDSGAANPELVADAQTVETSAGTPLARPASEPSDLSTPQRPASLRAEKTPKRPSAKTKANAGANDTPAPLASPSDCIDIRSASSTELQKLPGVGPGRADKIIALRERRPFTKTSELRKVKGIGQATFTKLKDRLCPI